jgi:hypothetical protein
MPERGAGGARAASRGVAERDRFNCAVRRSVRASQERELETHHRASIWDAATMTDWPVVPATFTARELSWGAVCRQIERETSRSISSTLFQREQGFKALSDDMAQVFSDGICSLQGRTPKQHYRARGRRQKSGQGRE